MKSRNSSGYFTNPSSQLIQKTKIQCEKRKKEINSVNGGGAKRGRKRAQVRIERSDCQQILWTCQLNICGRTDCSIIEKMCKTVKICIGGEHTNQASKHVGTCSTKESRWKRQDQDKKEPKRVTAKTPSKWTIHQCILRAGFGQAANYSKKNRKGQFYWHPYLKENIFKGIIDINNTNDEESLRRDEA